MAFPLGGDPVADAPCAAKAGALAVASTGARGGLSSPPADTLGAGSTGTSPARPPASGTDTSGRGMLAVASAMAVAFPTVSCQPEPSGVVKEMTIPLTLASDWVPDGSSWG